MAKRSWRLRIGRQSKDKCKDKSMALNNKKSSIHHVRVCLARDTALLEQLEREEVQC